MKCSLDQNKYDYVTIQEFETIEEWNQYQEVIDDEVEDIEVIDNSDEENECIIL